MTWLLSSPQFGMAQDSHCRPQRPDYPAQSHRLAVHQEVRTLIGMSIRGERGVYWRLTGRQNLEYFASLYGIRGSAARARVE